MLLSAVIVSIYHFPIFPSLEAYEKYAVILRTFVSKNSAGKGRAVLEYVGLDTPASNMVYENNPKNEEAAVQAGLLQWVIAQSGR